MNTIGERISEVIVAAGLKKVEFARRLNLSQPFVSELCSGKNNPSDRTIADICREFNVNETWLRTGDGPMFKPKSRNEELFEFLNTAVEEDGIKARLLTVMARLSEDQWELLADMARKLAEEEMEKADPE